MLSKKKLDKINRLKKRREMIEINIDSMKQAISRINKKLFVLIVGKK